MPRPHPALAEHAADALRRPGPIRSDLLRAVRPARSTSSAMARGRDEEGYFWITGRIDDVINVSGHRLSTAEIESALVGSHRRSPRPRSSRPATTSTGQAVIAVRHARPGRPARDDRARQRSCASTWPSRIGKLARPQADHLGRGPAQDQVRRRSVRRLLRDIAEGREPGDATTLGDPSVLGPAAESNAAERIDKNKRRESGHDDGEPAMRRPGRRSPADLGTVRERVALVTGGTRGIGAAISSQLAGAGADVAAGYWRGRESAEKFHASMTADHPGRKITVHEGNIGHPDDCRRVLREVIDQHGRLDILVNNAGITIDRTVAKMTDEDWLTGDRGQPVRRVLHGPGGGSSTWSSAAPAGSSTCRR